MTIHITADDAEVSGREAKHLAPQWEAEGRAAALAGVHVKDCPHVAGEPVYAWERGYEAGMRTAEVAE